MTASSGDAAKVYWSVFKVDGADLTVVDQDTASNGDKIDLGSRAALKAVTLKSGERLGISAWRRDFNYNGGATISAVSIDPAP